MRVTLLRVDKDREFGGVAEEEDWSIIEHPIPIAFFGIEFHGETSWISGRVWTALLTSYC